ncbi:LysR family transcriptional regulator [Streptomyces mangrovisoli]|uniref:LysR family transcriptional regulator n=1 Tax=Streptomyces mangrovisoli TaxID=1428628 RepID=A0A1J4NW25_9ACTN|nr:LysR family transcriptional regulator [Streptomyces mangrovisoli]
MQRLRVLRAVADHGSFNRAAAFLRITPSAVSQQVAALERGLGAQVVARSTRGVTLTPAGHIMVAAAESVAAELSQARQRVAQLATGRARLTVAAFTSGGRLLLPGAFTRLLAVHPHTELHVREGEPEDTLPLVRQGAVDLALAYHFDGPLPSGPGHGAGLRWTPLLEDPLYVVLPQEHRLADRDALDLAELAAEPWVLGCLKTEAYLRRHAERAGFEPKVHGTTTDYFFARSLVAAGAGISLIPAIGLTLETPAIGLTPESPAIGLTPETPSIGLTPDIPGLRAVPIKAPTPIRYIGVAAIDHGNRPHVTTFIHALREQAAVHGSPGTEPGSPTSGRLGGNHR